MSSSPRQVVTPVAGLLLLAAASLLTHGGSEEGVSGRRGESV